jgi:predicted transcriptional regulator
MKELTKAEEQIMQVLWKINKGFVKDVIEELPQPRPAYNTVSTIIRILESKGFVSHKAYGKTHEYFPLIARNEYTRSLMGNMIQNYFSNSYRQMVSFFASNNNISIKELEEIKKIMNTEISKKKSRDKKS